MKGSAGRLNSRENWKQNKKHPPASHLTLPALFLILPTSCLPSPCPACHSLLPLLVGRYLVSPILPLVSPLSAFISPLYTSRLTLHISCFSPPYLLFHLSLPLVSPTSASAALLPRPLRRGCANQAESALLGSLPAYGCAGIHYTPPISFIYRYILSICLIYPQYLIHITLVLTESSLKSH